MKKKQRQFEKGIEDNITHFQSYQNNTLLQQIDKFIISRQLSKLTFITT